MAQLAQPPGLPAPMEGILNMEGRAIPVLRLDKLLALPAGRPGLYSMLVVVKGVAQNLSAILVDRVTEILSVPSPERLPVPPDESFNACAEAVISNGGRTIYILSVRRILLEKERESLEEFQATAQRRIEQWETRVP